MSNIFAERLSSLRKEHRISQKEASAFFGISQALLSHYENGVRQCGIEFIINAAGFYGVSTDYLLGLSDAKTPSEEAYLASQPGDGKLSYTTLRRTFGILCQKLDDPSAKSVSGELSSQCLYLYKLMLNAVVSEKMPSDWLGIKSASEASDLIKIINSLNLSVPLTDGKITLLKSGESVPECVQTVIKEAKRIFADMGSQMFEKLSDY